MILISTHIRVTQQHSQTCLLILSARLKNAHVGLYSICVCVHVYVCGVCISVYAQTQAHAYACGAQ